jgi:DNA-binding IclR family transcriptional regulator
MKGSTVCSRDGVTLEAMPSTGKRSAVHKVADVLRALVGSRPRSLTAISAATGLPLSTAHRIVTELVESDLLRRTGEGYYLLHESMVLPQVSPNHGSGTGTLPWGAIAVLDDLAVVTCRVTRLGWRHNDDMRYVERIPHRSDLNPRERGDERPLHASAMGKVLLSFATPSDLDVALVPPLAAYTANTVTSIDELAEQLARTRRTLVAHEFGEFDPDASTIAVPVFGGRRFPILALEMQTTDGSDARRLEHALQIAARALRRVLLAATARDGRV